MVTTRSQDKMTFADSIRAKGFSLADCKFVKLNALFPIMLGLAHATVALWCGSGLAAAVVAAVPIADEKVPLFTIFVLPVYAILLSIVALEGLAALAPNGYQSQIGRAAKAPGAIEIRLSGLGLDGSPSPRSTTRGNLPSSPSAASSSRRGETACPLLRARGAPPRLPPRLPAALRARRRPRPHRRLTGLYAVIWSRPARCTPRRCSRSSPRRRGDGVGGTISPA